MSEPGQTNGSGSWRTRVLSSGWPWNRRPLRPADVSSGLLSVMLARQNLLEDVRYQKVVPNHFIVEVNALNYAVNYQPIERQIVEQWSEKLLRHLVTTNSRLGRKEYRFGGQVQVEIRPAADLPEHQARVLFRIDSNAGEGRLADQPVRGACLEAAGMGKRWAIQEGVMTIGRSQRCSVHLDSPEVNSTRLISAVHAHLRCKSGRCQLYDGSPDGKPSTNGTYVNGQRVGPGGRELRDGDLLIMAAADPGNPRTDTHGVVAIRFREECR